MTIPDTGLMMMDNGASCLPVPPDEERRVVEELTGKAEANLKEGNVYFVVSNRWYCCWQKYVRQNSDRYLADEPSLDSQRLKVVSSEMAERPGPIDNSDIISDEHCEGDQLELRRMLEEGRDYVLVPQQVWEKLFGWYKGGPALPRKMISQGYHNKSYSVEVYLLCLKLIDSRDNSQSIIRISRKASTHDLYEKVCILRKVDVAKVNIWDYFNKQKTLLLDRPNKTLEEESLQMDQDILLEVQVDGVPHSGNGMDSTRNDLALVVLEPSRSSMTIAGGPTMSNGHSSGYNFYQRSGLSSSSSRTEDGYDVFNSANKGERGGLAGLQNLGNTCFMNSAIQCLVHTTPIVEYFLQDYTEDINMENPLGMRGELALAFGELLRKLWSSGRTTIAPRAFKAKLARFAPQFSGYNQHDSQELLAFLLDGLHEDLNRVKKKPYIEAKDSDGRPDREVAGESWRYHKARNDSIIVDVCQGQYKSTLVCPVCGKISITFDPFMYLTLPLPSSVTRTMTVTVFYGDGSGLLTPFTVTVLKHGCCKDLTQTLGAACCLRADECLLLAEVYEHRIYRYLDNSLDLSSIKDEDYIVAYRLPKVGAGRTKVEITHRWLERVGPDTFKGHERKFSGTPLVMYLAKDSLCGEDILGAVGKVLSPLRRVYSPSKSSSEKASSFVSKDGEESSSSSNGQSGPGNDEMEGVEDDSSGELPLFQLSLVDDRGANHKPIHRDTVISGQTVKIVLDWTERELEQYDASYLMDLPEVHKSGFTVKKTRQEAISLFSCLDAFLKEEPLGPDDMWYCPGCKEHRQATKKLDLWKLPDILVVHLKRFSYSRYLKNKLDTFVNFPTHNLDLTKYVKSIDGQSYVYELYAISNHYGGLGGGHYTAYAKLIDENRWYHFDDSHVSPVGEADVRTSAAYLLFYQRVKTDSGVRVGETSQSHMSS
ncbi:ubiquitin carboxyl-terminal hydrolase 9-like [Syzygium oleosum]|uniref:ubiquitin carboxyl-terminal hydrolase 9-like n=1 Tax=Syzygium oleosum TaxID=219896 RepID=UPI0024B955E7|nr:ubiquitin carboxyl-terminal hydrolase 9-like [Syzygium oleosum]